MLRFRNNPCPPPLELLEVPSCTPCWALAAGRALMAFGVAGLLSVCTPSAGPCARAAEASLLSSLLSDAAELPFLVPFVMNDLCQSFNAAVVSARLCFGSTPARPLFPAPCPGAARCSPAAKAAPTVFTGGPSPASPARVVTPSSLVSAEPSLLLRLVALVLSAPFKTPTPTAPRPRPRGPLLLSDVSSVACRLCLSMKLAAASPAAAVAFPSAGPPPRITGLLVPPDSSCRQLIMRLPSLMFPLKLLAPAAGFGFSPSRLLPRCCAAAAFSLLLMFNVVPPVVVAVVDDVRSLVVSA
mmetsp:Transcript_332/g.648  ORF Transcript_332/g.648 Transcript_332/m.648 type:complete len:298 (-) Transcript_332:1081-1974(-)